LIAESILSTKPVPSNGRAAVGPAFNLRYQCRHLSLMTTAGVTVIPSKLKGFGDGPGTQFIAAWADAIIGG